jgi:PhnB protein
LAANPIPDGFRAVTPYLVMNNGAEAIEWYKIALGAEEVFRNTAPDGKTITHAVIRIGDSSIMLSDEMPQSPVKSPKTANVATGGLMLYVGDVDTVFQRAVEAGATIKMPVNDMFWGDRMGNLVDPFGHYWSIATHKEDLAPAEVQRRARELYSKTAGGH